MHLGDSKKKTFHPSAGKQIIALLFSAFLLTLTGILYSWPVCFDEFVEYSNTRVLSIDNPELLLPLVLYTASMLLYPPPCLASAGELGVGRVDYELCFSVQLSQPLV